MKKRICSLLLSILLIASVLPVSADELEGGRLYRGINDMVEYIVAHYHFGTSDQKLLRAVMEDAAMNNHGTLSFERAVMAMMNTLDPYSMYYSESEYQAFMETTNGSFSGIGIRFMTAEDSLLVVEVFDNGPAAEAGLIRGDKITAIDGVSVSGKTQTELLSMVRGESGTSVNLTVQHDGVTLSVPVMRAPIEEQEVTWEMLPEKIGYIRITSFNPLTDQKLAAAMDAIVRSGSMKMIIDLRDNGGGVTGSALRALDQIIPAGKAVLNVKFKDEEVTYTSQNAARQNPYKIVLLVNENTASAAEIFSGAMKDNEAGILIGTTTYGKGTMQEVRHLSVGGGIRLTIGEFFTPNGDTIRDVGITPNITVDNNTYYLDESEFSPLDLFQNASVGTQSDNVLAIEERLAALGYFGGTPDRVFDSDTMIATEEFQAVCGLSMSGIADTLTLISLNNAEYDQIMREDDVQLRAAIDYLAPSD